MIFSDMQKEVISFRFNNNLQGSVRRWLNLRYAQLWGSAAWPWRNAVLVSDQIVTGSGQGVWPADLQRAISVQNTTDGSPVEYMGPKEFFLSYVANNSSGAPVNNYTVLNSDVPTAMTLVPFFAPDLAGTSLTIVYERKLGHYEGGVYKVGPMVNDSDVPAWPDEWCYLIVAAAMATGLKMENDDSFPALEQEVQQGLQLMAASLLPGDVAVNQQYGAPWNVGPRGG